MFNLTANDPRGELVDASELDAGDRAQIDGIMNAMGRLRQAEQELSEASSKYMKLGQTDMRALHFLIISQHREDVVTPSRLAAHLAISSAATTKLLDRLTAGGHITRAPHPTDRRALTIQITPETHQAAMETVGRAQARRVIAAAKLSPEERDVVARFLNDMADQLALGGEEWRDSQS